MFSSQGSGRGSINLELGRTRSHRNKKLYNCPYCTYTTEWSTSMKKHVVTHTGVRAFACTHCTATYTRKDHLTRHELVHKIGHFEVVLEENPHHSISCAKCSATFLKDEELSNHLFNAHKNDSTHACNLCSYTSTEHNNLRTHFWEVHLMLIMN